MFDSGKLFKTAKKLATKTMDTSQQIMGNVTDKICLLYTSPSPRDRG